MELMNLNSLFSLDLRASHVVTVSQFIKFSIFDNTKRLLTKKLAFLLAEKNIQREYKA